MKMKTIAFTTRGGAAWSTREDRELARLVRACGLDATDRRTKALTRRRRFFRWAHVARSLGRTDRAAQSRWNVLQACARLCACKKKRKK